LKCFKVEWRRVESGSGKSAYAASSGSAPLLAIKTLEDVKSIRGLKIHKKLPSAWKLLPGVQYNRQLCLQKKSPTDSNTKLPFVGLVNIVTVISGYADSVWA
jgi:hypothetical protein